MSACAQHAVAFLLIALGIGLGACTDRLDFTSSSQVEPPDGRVEMDAQPLVDGDTPQEAGPDSGRPSDASADAESDSGPTLDGGADGASPAADGGELGPSLPLRARFDTTGAGVGVAQDVITFPLLLRLSGAFPFDELADDGTDLQVRDPDGSSLPRRIVHWDRAAGQALVWVLVPTVSGNSSSDYVELSSDPSAVDLPVFRGVNGFAAVWHLDEPDGTATAHDPAGQRNGGMLGETLATQAIVGRGRRLAAAQSIAVAHQAELDLTGSLAVSAWISLDMLSDMRWYGILAKRAGGAVVDSEPVAYSFFVSPLAGVPTLTARIGRGAPLFPAEPGQLTAGRFHHVAMSYDQGAGELSFYLDGVRLGAATSVPQGPASDTQEVLIGGEGGDDPLGGVIDEVWLSSFARDPAFIKLTYENQRTDSRLLTFEPAD